MCVLNALKTVPKAVRQRRSRISVLVQNDQRNNVDLSIQIKIQGSYYHNWVTWVVSRLVVTICGVYK